MKPVRPDRKQPATNASVRKSPDCANESPTTRSAGVGGLTTSVDVTNTTIAERDQDDGDRLELPLQVGHRAFLDRRGDLDHLRRALVGGEDAPHRGRSRRASASRAVTAEKISQNHSPPSSRRPGSRLRQPRLIIGIRTPRGSAAGQRWLRTLAVDDRRGAEARERYGAGTRVESNLPPNGSAVAAVGRSLQVVRAPRSRRCPCGTAAGPSGAARSGCGAGCPTSAARRTRGARP